MCSRRVGVLAVQGSFAEHTARLHQLGCETAELRQLADLAQPLDGLVLPGGESTTQAKLLRDLGLLEPLRQLVRGGLPVLGTCAGLILLAETVESTGDGRRPGQDGERNRPAPPAAAPSAATETAAAASAASAAKQQSSAPLAAAIAGASAPAPLTAPPPGAPCEQCPRKPAPRRGFPHPARHGSPQRLWPPAGQLHHRSAASRETRRRAPRPPHFHPRPAHRGHGPRRRNPRSPAQRAGGGALRQPNRLLLPPRAQRRQRPLPVVPFTLRLDSAYKTARFMQSHTKL